MSVEQVNQAEIARSILKQKASEYALALQGKNGKCQHFLSSKDVNLSTHTFFLEGVNNKKIKRV